MSNPNNLFGILLFLFLFSCNNEQIGHVSALESKEDLNKKENVSLRSKVFSDNLKSPMGMEPLGALGIFVAEAGTGNNDGQITFISATGEQYPVIVNFPSAVRPDGNIAGTTHLGINRGILWAVNGVSGLLYRFELRYFEPNQPPVSAGNIYAEDLRTFIINSKFKNDKDESNIYNLTFDQHDNVYILDSSANAIIKRNKEGVLSVFTELPSSQDPHPSPESSIIEPVPTGIEFRQGRFFVSTFSGFPFPKGEAKIYEINRRGNIVDFQDGFTALVDLTLSKKKGGDLLTLEFGVFGEAGFKLNSGNLFSAENFGHGNNPIASELNYPTGITYWAGNKVLISSNIDGNIIEVDL